MGIQIHNMNTENNNNSQEKEFQPIEVSSLEQALHASIDPDLVVEFNSKTGDLELVCQGGAVIHCHVCVLAFQSDVIRRLLKHTTGKRLECKKFTSCTMTKFLQLLYT